MAVLRIILICALAILTSVTAIGQFTYTVTSIPDSAVVVVNGAIVGYTPYEYKYRWNQAKEGKIRIAVSSPGYETWTDEIIEKPKDFSKYKRAHLRRKLPSYDLESSSTLIAFDKLVADFKEGTPVGKYIDGEGNTEVLKWEGSIKIGDNDFEEAFNYIAENAGFKTPEAKRVELFSGATADMTSYPRFLVGVQLLECDINLQHSNLDHYGAGSVVGRTNLAFEWQIMDQSTGKVVHKYSNVGLSKYRRGYSYSGDNIMAFEGALIDFFDNSALQDLVRTAHLTGTSLLSAESDGSSSRKIAVPDIPEFESLGQMIRHTSKSCVTIVTDGGHGSGVIINTEGYVLSAYHVVSGVNRIEVQFSDGLQQEAKIVAYDSKNDIVLLDISGSGYKPLPLALDQEIYLGDDVITIGTPANLSLGQSVAKGIVSGKRMFDDHIYLQTDMAVSPGNSGGPLLNEKGEVIGIVQRKIIDEGVEGIGFALPIKRAMEKLSVNVVEIEKE